MATPSKRKVLTLDKRIQVIERSKTKSARKIAEEFQIGKTQVQNILKRKADLMADYENNAPWVMGSSTAMTVFFM